MKIIQRGAEAILYKVGNKLVKERIKKGYRLQQIDKKLRKFRTRREVKLLEKCNDLFVPKVLDFNDKKMIIEMEFIEGELIKNTLDKISINKRDKICKTIGQQISAIHTRNIIHGDLTTSNMILKDDKVFFIDFGLGFISNKIEDKAVDLHLLKQALESKHYKNFEDCFNKILEGYKKNLKYKEIIDRLEKVESRGRYKKK